MIGERRNWLTCIGRSDRLDSEGKPTFIVVRCDCGTEKVVSQKNFRSGGTKSCGCQRRRLQREASTKHGGTGTPEFRSWQGILARCLNERETSFAHYGGRGITVCDRWRAGEGGKSGFECFLADVGPRPHPRMSIDRINNDGPYEPGNVQWATRIEQNRNKRNNRVIVFRGHPDAGGSDAAMQALVAARDEALRGR